VYDIAIIGAGPAGSTLARLVGERRKVLLVDRRPLDRPSRGTPEPGAKCCGGLLAPDAQVMLARQGLGLPREVLIGPQLFVVRTIDLEAGLERFYQRHYINVHRRNFDRWLLALVPPAVERKLGWTLKAFEQKGTQVTLTLRRDGEEVTETARILVGADGAGSIVRRRAFPEAPGPTLYVARQEWFRVEEALPYFSAIFDRAITDFYCWTIPKEDCLVLGAARGPGRGAAAKFERLKAKLTKFGFCLKDPVASQGGSLFRPRRASQVVTGRANVALVGEAAGWISPSSAEGISYAFRSAIALADACVAAPDNPVPAYRKMTRGLRRNILLKNLKAPLMYRSAWRRLVMRSGLRSVKVDARAPFKSRNWLDAADCVR